MLREESPTDTGPYFSDVWANAQRSRTAFIRSFFWPVWQRFSDAKYDDRVTAETDSGIKE